MAKKFSRKQPSRNVGSKILICCEDEFTSSLYFKAIRSSIRIPKERIDVFNAYPYTDPLSIVKAVAHKREDLKQDKAWGTDDSAWAVFDGDEHQEDNSNKWLDAITVAVRKDIQLAIVNLSFELWYLLHFQERLATIHRTQALKLLERHIPKYDKSVCYYNSHLSELTQEAIKRAR